MNYKSRKNKIRKKLGLPKLINKKIRCLKCDRIFYSVDITKRRLCNLCRKKNKEIYYNEIKFL